MATTSRLPLAARPQGFVSVLSPSPMTATSMSMSITTTTMPAMTRTSTTATTRATIKRPRSPDNMTTQDSWSSQKRARASTMPAIGREVQKKDRRKLRDKDEEAAREAEWRTKYIKSFPKWTFCFHSDNPELTSYRRRLEARILQLGGKVDDFFSIDVSHLITNEEVPVTHPDPSDMDNKENVAKLGHSLDTTVKSPGKRSRPGAVPDPMNVALGNDPVSKAKHWNIKIWSFDKLDIVLSRCLQIPITQSSVSRSIHPPPLRRLLQDEKIHGTSERDRSQKRHNFVYFNKGSYFLLLEDARQEYATMAAHEYVIPKGRDAEKKKMPWPVLYCHPRSRGPFIPYDEKEKRRWEKAQQANKEDGAEILKRLRKKAHAEKMKQKALVKEGHARQTGDLRRAISLSSLRAKDEFDVPGDLDSAHASGYLASGNGGYMAASGNSVGITSTTGTTSTTGHSFGTVSSLPSMRPPAQREVTTFRRYSSVTTSSKGKPAIGNMGPPSVIPEKRALKKSRSTNSLRLPKREEGSKPGYCESCRVRFDDFKDHVKGRKHRKFAENDANFSQLDFVLARVKRRTIQQVQEQQMRDATADFEDRDLAPPCDVQDTYGFGMGMVDLDDY